MTLKWNAIFLGEVLDTGLVGAWIFFFFFLLWP